VTADSAGGPAEGDDQPQVMKVRTELVLEQLVSRVLGRALELQSAKLPAEADRMIEAGPEPTQLARLGYASRVAETEMFEPARQPMPWLSELLDQRIEAEGDRQPAIAALCRELATEEPDERPDPGEGSWRVPGPGGHVRHFLALAAADELVHAATDGKPPPIARDLSAGEAKRCFLFGFYASCCEETATR
jgi:hypothetical protein